MKTGCLNLHLQYFATKQIPDKGKKRVKNETLFTQQEVNEIVQMRIKREQKKLQQALVRNIEDFLKGPFYRQ